MYKPDDKFAIFGVVSPVDHKYSKGGNGSVTCVFAEPLEPPKHKLSKVVIETSIGLG